ncbi:hypothetical protein EV384_4362 [Micromonospora kangleipakensis]|uniref:Uncharacterized protein n=1 Tax=Micromonospora kangleipakensis TaxID=1077942 RepID=A0A4Q8BF65_9ACTN|nr:hypothetical protein EV384_4362 [Micromonospora kangleipakensis]
MSSAASNSPIATRWVLAWLFPTLRPAFEAAVADLGVLSAADRRRRADEVVTALPGWWAVSGAVGGWDVAG